MTDGGTIITRLEEADRRLLKSLDYVVSGGEVFKVSWESYHGEMYVERLDEIPTEYWGRYE